MELPEVKGQPRVGGGPTPARFAVFPPGPPYFMRRSLRVPTQSPTVRRAK